MDDRDIIDLYWARDQRAVGETAAKYGPYCAAVADNILHDSRDTEECVNDTWLKAWNAMPPQRPQRLKLFLARITRNLAFDRWRKGSAQRRGGGELPLALECKLISYDPDTHYMFGEIVNVSVDEKAVTPEGALDVAKLAPITYDNANKAYLALGQKVGDAFSDGKKFQ